MIKRKKIIIAVFVVIAVAVVSYLYFGRAKQPNYEFVVASKQEIVQEVSVTGRVESAEAVDLAFEKSGRVAGVYVDVGSKVSVGQLLASLNNAELVAQINAAEANIKAQEARLAELINGTRPEEIQIYEVKVSNAATALAEAQKDLLDKIGDAYTKSDDAVRNKVDQFFANPRSANPTLNFIIPQAQLTTDVEWGRLLMEKMLTGWKPLIDGASVDGDISGLLSVSKNNLNEVKSFLDKVALAVNSLTANVSFSQTVIDGYKADVSTARSNINSAVVSVSTAEEKTKAAVSSLLLAKRELELKKAGTAIEQISAQEAQLAKAKAERDQYKAQFSKSIIFSPIKGVVTKRDLNVSEIVSANIIVFSVMSEGRFEIETNIPEADIAKVKVGDTAQVTLDTYGENVVFEAIVTSVEPAETIIEGVATYKTKLQFIKADDRIKSGMTANVDILAARISDVIVVPQRAVTARNGDVFVQILEGENLREVKVKTGLRGSDGGIEIVEGVSVGDKVVTFTKTQ